MDKARTIVSEGRVYRPLMDKSVTAEDWKKAKEELNETSEMRTKMIKAFKELITNEHEFLPRMDDLYLLRFLRCRKFHLDNAYKLMRDHLNFRDMNPKVFPSPSSMQKVFQANVFNYLPHRDHQGRAIFVVKIKNWNPNEIPYVDLVAAGNLISEHVLENHVTQINGYIGLWDFKGFTFKQFITYCSPKNIMLTQTIIQDRFPGRFKMFLAVNCYDLVHMGWKLLKPLLREKFKKRIKILGTGITGLHQYIDPSILPEEYGGNMPPLDCEDILQQILDNEQRPKYKREFSFHDENTDSIQ